MIVWVIVGYALDARLGRGEIPVRVEIFDYVRLEWLLSWYTHIHISLTVESEYIIPFLHRYREVSRGRTYLVKVFPKVFVKVFAKVFETYF